MAKYTPAALFGPSAIIGRTQFFMSFFYEGVAVVMTERLLLASAGKPPTTAVILTICATVLGLIAFIMMTMAIRARLVDGGMSLRWLSLPMAFLALEVLAPMFASPGAGPASLASPSGLLFLLKIAMVALLILLLMVPTSPLRAAAGSAK